MTDNTPRPEPMSREQVLAVLDRSRGVLAELYANYGVKIGPYATQAQKCNGRLREARAAIAALYDERDRLSARINAPEIDAFLRAVHVEAVHQVERWGTSHDRAKRPADWFWLVGYLSGKALHAAVSGDRDKALHHCISTAAALYNWHSAIKGVDVRMCPGRSDLAELVESQFPKETA